jgi:hypothetical protein
MESAEAAWPTKGNASRSKVLCTHLIRRYLLHSLQGKQGPKVDAGARKGMLRVIGDAAIWSIVSKPHRNQRWASVLRPAALAAGSCYIDTTRGETPSRKAYTAYGPLARPD